MRGRLDITLLEPHALRLQKMLAGGKGIEAAAYLQFGISDIAADPWSGRPRTRLVSHQFSDIDSAERVSASPVHVTWSTAGFMRLLSEAKAKGCIPAIVHTHPGSHAFFSDQDDANEDLEDYEPPAVDEDVYGSRDEYPDADDEDFEDDDGNWTAGGRQVSPLVLRCGCRRRGRSP